MRSVVFLTVAVCALMALLSTTAHADASTAKAKQLYDDGVTSYNLGHFEQALDAFEKAYRIRHDAAFLFNIAQCQRNLKRYEDAQRTFRAYLRESPDLPDRTRAQIQQIMEEMDRALAEQRAKQPPTGTQAPAAIQPSESPAQQAATTPPPVPVATTREANETERHAARTMRIAGLAVGGFGIVSLALGGVFTALANDANGHIVTGDAWSAATEDRRNTYQALDISFFAIGGAAIATGAVLYLIGRHEDHKRYPVERVQVAPAIGPRVAGLGLNGRF